ncbi:periplasmic binding protein [Mobiluncus mulieris 28-1]|uniref:ABC transporter substrate-binding protein n=1 Tax=Mobiluncus mulieris TaxID=2052 RepID=A0A2J9KPG2_9ACTO|nr:ABC transporter substrate-binding protein [Mobiluncus mulieris]EEJ53500.1 periplasmic binding protein [Mobiluncus mulieris ATCC 35243]EEZ91328.1 periplasmic binding protein [Mobiluncus mulieris 28-1]MCU9970771.1 ABC transporter substrate-binding protein [Mobiluncus mulieris]MCU9993904.1 ABC transporter substrate-binding protein [Mobiluncus mulieris]MCV0002545.1 ABC transporter substrate-binding protein [Mobiluncus mulieris]
MFRKSVALVVGILAVSLSLSGCTGKPEVSPEASSKPEKTVEASGPREVTDHGGHKAQVPAKIEKVAFEQIPLMSTFVAFHDGKAPGLVATSKHIVNQMDGTILAEKVPEALKVDTSFDDAGVPNGESLAAIKPDVVFNNCFNKKNSEIIDAVGLPRVGFSTMGAPTETYVKWFKLLEDVYGEPGKMDDKIAAGKKLIDDAQARVSKINAGQKKSVMVVMKAAPGKLIVAGGRPGWFTDSWANRMNFNSVTTGSEQGFMPVNAEQIAAWNPDVILVTGKGMSNMTAKEILNNQIEGLDLSGLRAVQNKQVYTTQLGMWNWFTPNPDAPVVANWMGQKLYPEQFKDVDLVKMVQEHYKTTYGWDLDTAKAEKILDPDA